MRTRFSQECTAKDLAAVPSILVRGRCCCGPSLGRPCGLGTLPDPFSILHQPSTKSDGGQLLQQFIIPRHATEKVVSGAVGRFSRDLFQIVLPNLARRGGGFLRRARYNRRRLSGVRGEPQGPILKLFGRPFGSAPLGPPRRAPLRQEPADQVDRWRDKPAATRATAEMAGREGPRQEPGGSDRGRARGPARTCLRIVARVAEAVGTLRTRF